VTLPAHIGSRADLAVVVPDVAECHVVFERGGEVVVGRVGSAGISVGGEAVDEASPTVT
jgi:hypothetical protein